MARKRWAPNSPEVIEAMIRRVRSMTREELLESLAWRPEGVEETWVLQRNGAAPSPGPEGEREEPGGGEGA